MKRIIAILLMGVMVLSIVSCGGTNNTENNTQNSTQQGTQNNVTPTTEGTNGAGTTNNTTNNNTNITVTDITKVKDAKEILTKIWATYEEKDTDNYVYNDKFSIVGGHHEAYVEGAPETYDLTKAEDLEKHHFFPAAKVNLTDDVATMTNVLEAHEFSVSVYHVKDSANVNEVVKAIKDTMDAHKWTNSEDPDELLIVTLGDRYVLSAFGDDDLLHYLKTSIEKVFGDSVKTVVKKDID